MRVPVRLGMVERTPPGVRRAAAYYVPRRRLGSYGADVRSVDPFSLVFRGNMGDNGGGAYGMEFVATWPSDEPAPLYSETFNFGVAAQGFDTAWLNTYEAPAYQAIPYNGGYISTSDILRTQSGGGLYPGGMTEEQPRTVLPGQIFGEQPVPVTVSPERIYGGEGGGGSSSEWFKAIPAITQAGASIATSVARVVQGTGGGAGGGAPVRYVTPTGQIVTAPAGSTAPIQYTIPATATAPAQRVTYNPSTGQVTAVPLSSLSQASMLPSFLQPTPGAPWYQNPVVWVGAGVGVLVLALAAGGRR